MSTEQKLNLPPEIPPEVEARQKKPTALTKWAAEDIEAESYASEEDGSEIPLRSQVKHDRAILLQVSKINHLTVRPVGYEPHAGLLAAQVNEIMAKSYEGAPKMGKQGDLTAAFIVWLFQHHPKDADVRYHTRLMPSVGVWIQRNQPEFLEKLARSEPVTTESITRPLSEKERLKREIEELSKPPEAEDPELIALRKQRDLLLKKKNTPKLPAPPKVRPRKIK